MYFYLEGHNFHFECENLCRVFFPYSPVKRVEEYPASTELTACAIIKPVENGYQYIVELRDNGACRSEVQLHTEIAEYPLTRLLFQLFSAHTGMRPQWGMLTGIHPVKLLRNYEHEFGSEKAQEIFREQFFVSEKKLALAEQTLEIQRPVIDALEKNDFCLYISIPFCPSRCSYCSFVSQSVAQAKKLMAPYYELLLQEIAETAQVAKSLSLRLIAVYIGGGTPTTLSAQQLQGLCEAVNGGFDLSACREFTVEAGRPDTITAEKLAVLKACGVTRISINPQSLSDEVLKNIGRAHSVREVYEAFAMAGAAGFSSVNADLIVGLPGDSLAGFRHTLSGVLEMGASNITVHALALKRSAGMVTQQGGEVASHRDADMAAAMMDASVHALEANGFSPYYLYRQTRMAGNLENTGWCREGEICRYNIYTMDESVTVLACGAGGVSKLKDPHSNRLERIFNFKYPYEYINRYEEIQRRKAGVTELYEQFRKRIY